MAHRDPITIPVHPQRTRERIVDDVTSEPTFTLLDSALEALERQVAEHPTGASQSQSARNPLRSVTREGPLSMMMAGPSFDQNPRPVGALQKSQLFSSTTSVNHKRSAMCEQGAKSFEVAASSAVLTESRAKETAAKSRPRSPHAHRHTTRTSRKARLVLVSAESPSCPLLLTYCGDSTRQVGLGENGGGDLRERERGQSNVKSPLSLSA